MSLKLKEDPREWLKFTAATCCALAVLGLLLYWRHRLSGPALLVALAAAASLLAGGALRPRWLRLPYRLGMRTGYLVGQGAGRVLLLVFFLTAITPLGWLLRLAGKDLLEMRKPTGAASYWHRPRPAGRLDTQF